MRSTRLAGLAALAWLDLRRARNRLHRLLRHPFWLLFYAALAGALIWLILELPAARGAESAPAGWGLWTHAAGAWMVLVLGARLWGATSRSPFQVTTADAVLLFTSPVASRDLVLFQLLRSAVHRLVTELPVLVAWLFILIRTGLPLERGDLVAFYLFLLLVGLWGEGLHAITWLALERRPWARAVQARRRLRAILIAAVVGGLLWLVWPLPAVLLSETGQSQVLQLLLGRAEHVAAVPPVSWAGAFAEAVVGPGGQPWAALGSAVGVLALLWLAAWSLGEGYYEPLVLQGEEDARLQQVISSWKVDVQGEALGYLGALNRAGRIQTLRLGGTGAWALFWEQANRWLRLELGAWRLAGLILALFGGLLGVGVRAGLALTWLWLAPIGLAVLSTPWGYLAEELRRPYIYLIPDPPWKRLVAASLVSAVDEFLSCGLMMLAGVLVASAGLGFFLVGLAALAAASWLAQGALALSSVAVPGWLGRATRTVMQTLIAFVGLGPGLVVAWLVVAAGGNEAGALIAASLATLASGSAFLALAAVLFKNAEMAG
ncbi:MAG TPA: putative ABC exporter domain-containing protein [Limnochorda sp.]